MKLSSLLFVLLGIGATQIAIGASCKDTQVQACESITYVLKPSKDCKKYYEFSNGEVKQCKQKNNTHSCTTGDTMNCTPPKSGLE